ncbi:hypothetical protein [Kordiimonas sp.]|uniref:hypothetical protein n=1 Tax=Kordiimonas sp. TaxID=1970157 RepID=UPI003A94ABA3
MIGIINTETGELREVVDDLDGTDIDGCTITSVPEDWPDACVWDVATQGFVPPPLGPLKSAAKAKVDAQASALRAAVLTNAAGQQMVYLAKEAEARAYLADTSPDYPLLAAEIGITGGTLAEVAATVLTRADECRTALAALEAVRLTAKRQIDMASSAEAIEAVFSALVWPTP